MTAFAQPSQYTPMTAQGYQFKRILCDSTLHLPSFCGVPNIRNSTAKNGFTKLDDNSILFGLGMINGIGNKASDLILKARGRKPFTSMADFFTRINRTKINSGVVSILAKVGAFDSFGYDRVKLVEKLPDIFDYYSKVENYQTRIVQSFERNKELDAYPALLDDWTTKVKAGLS